MMTMSLFCSIATAFFNFDISSLLKVNRMWICYN